MPSGSNGGKTDRKRRLLTGDESSEKERQTAEINLSARGKSHNSIHRPVFPP